MDIEEYCFHGKGFIMMCKQISPFIVYNKPNISDPMCYTVAWLKSLASFTSSLSFLFLSLYLSHFLSFSLHILAAIEGLISKTNYVVWGCISLALVQKKSQHQSAKETLCMFKNGFLNCQAAPYLYRSAHHPTLSVMNA